MPGNQEKNREPGHAKGQPKEGDNCQSSSVRPVDFMLRRMQEDVLNIFNLGRGWKCPVFGRTIMSTHHVVLQCQPITLFLRQTSVKNVFDGCSAADC